MTDKYCVCVCTVGAAKSAISTVSSPLVSTSSPHIDSPTQSASTSQKCTFSEKSTAPTDARNTVSASPIKSVQSTANATRLGVPVSPAPSFSGPSNSSLTLQSAVRGGFAVASPITNLVVPLVMGRSSGKAILEFGGRHKVIVKLEEEQVVRDSFVWFCLRAYVRGTCV